MSIEEPKEPERRRIKGFCTIALVVSQIFVSEVHGTTIVGNRTPESVVIAADSMATLRGGGMPENTRKVCKIFNVKGVGFAIGGLVMDPLRDLDLEREITEVVWKQHSIHKAIILLENKMRGILGSELERLKNENQDLFIEYTKSKDFYVTSLFIATIEDGKPFAVVIGFKSKEQPNGQIKMETSTLSCPGDCDRGVFTFFLGEREAIEIYRKEHGKKFKMSPIDAAKFFVQLEIEAMPGKVGPPVDVLVVSPDNITWDSRKEECSGIPSGFRVPNANH